LPDYKAEFARHTELRTLADALQGADVFLGVSGANLLEPALLKSMAPQPVIFALANPDPEIRPEAAHAVRNDVIVATGRSDFPNQVNNVLCFPFIFRGALDVRASTIDDGMKVAAAHAIAQLAKESVPAEVLAAYPERREFAFRPRIHLAGTHGSAAARSRRGRGGGCRRTFGCRSTALPRSIPENLIAHVAQAIHSRRGARAVDSTAASAAWQAGQITTAATARGIPSHWATAFAAFPARRCLVRLRMPRRHGMVEDLDVHGRAVGRRAQPFNNPTNSVATAQQSLQSPENGF
jgi:malic enzyme